MQITPPPSALLPPPTRPEPPVPGSALPAGKPGPTPQQEPLMRQARALEAAFLAEMLAHAGLGETQGDAFGGGIGEEQFASFLRQEQATLLVARGGIGLAEHLFRAMIRGDAA